MEVLYEMKISVLKSMLMEKMFLKDVEVGNVLPLYKDGQLVGTCNVQKIEGETVILTCGVSNSIT